METIRGLYQSYYGSSAEGLRFGFLTGDDAGCSVLLMCEGEAAKYPKYAPLVLSGERKDDGSFHVEKAYPDASENSVREFLTRAKICNPGDVKKVFKAYPAGIWEMKSTDKSVLISAGVPETEAEIIVNSVCQVKNAYLAFMYMRCIGFTFENIALFYSRSKSFAELKENVYKVGYECEVPLRVCDFACRLENEKKSRLGDIFAFFDPNGKQRLDYIIRRAASFMQGDGHTFVYLSQLEGYLKKASGRQNPPHADYLLLYALSSPVFTLIGDKIYNAAFLECEESAARNLKRIEKGSPEPVPVSKALNNYMQRFDESQKAAVFGALQNTVSIITGGPGTGKTTITKAVVDACKEAGLRVNLCAPTGRAASMLKGRTKHPASTIHRMLGIRGISGERLISAFDEGMPLPCDVLIADESSMTDIVILDKMLRAVPDGCRLVFVGDADQLPSVSPGDTLRSLIETRRYPVFYLNETHRQAGGSVIMENAKAVLNGSSLKEGPGFEIKVFKTEEEMKKGVLADFNSYYKEKNPDSFQLLSPVKGGVLGAKALNAEIVQMIRPDKKARFAEGDKVMTIRNVYGKSKETSYINGDTGVIRKLDGGIAEIGVQDGGRILVGDFADLQHAYCATIHKSQGSEYDVTEIVLGKHGKGMVNRQLLYTAITRSKQKVILCCLEEDPVLSGGIRPAAKRNCGIVEALTL